MEESVSTYEEVNYSKFGAFSLLLSELVISVVHAVKTEVRIKEICCWSDIIIVDNAVSKNVECLD